MRIGFKSSTIMFDLEFCIKHCLKKPVVIKEITSLISKLRLMITLIKGVAFLRITTKTRRRYNVKAVGTFTIHDLRTTLKTFVTQCSKEGLSTDVSNENIRRKVSTKLHDLAYVFRKTLTKNLSPHRPYDLKIELK